MRDQLEEVLLLQTEYTHRNTPAMDRRGILIRHEIAGELRDWLPQLIEASGVQDLRAQGRDGTGPKTEIPWTQVFSESRAPSATVGWYVVYLFSAAGDRVYLSLNQGTTSWDGVGFRPRPYRERTRQVWGTEAVGDVAEGSRGRQAFDIGATKPPTTPVFGVGHAAG